MSFPIRHYDKLWYQTGMNCAICEKPKATLECTACHAHVCKAHAQFLEEGQFSFLDQIPQELSGSTFCEPCYSLTVVPAIEAYNQTLEQAKEILVFTKSQGKETRLIRRLEKIFRVEQCSDYDETILRLAFFATQAGFNAIIDVDIRSEKVRTGGYQTTIWSGSAVPANVQSHHLVKDRSIWQNPN